MEKIMDCGDAGGRADDFVESGDEYEDGLVGHTVSGILLFKDTGRCGWRTDADTD